MPSHRPDIPFPLGAFSACRALAIADATTWGAVTAIVGAWWASGCAPLPDDASGLAVLARCSPRQWRRVQAPVRAALAELLPGLAAEYARGRRMAAKRRAAASHAAAQLTNVLLWHCSTVSSSSTRPLVLKSGVNNHEC